MSKLFLEKILENKRKELKEMKSKVGIESIKAGIAELDPPRDFKGRLKDGKKMRLIAEIKYKSPSAGTLIREDKDPAVIAGNYQKSGASAISVVTDKEFFGGDVAIIQKIKKTVILPVLRKDFIIDEYQIYESRKYGADALLLIAGILSGKQLKEFYDLAAGLGMCPLVEVHTVDDVQKALEAGAEVIGINNRNLYTFETDIFTTIKLKIYIKSDRVVVSESGIRTREDVELLKEKGVNAILVGETLLKSNNVAKTIKNLIN